MPGRPLDENSPARLKEARRVLERVRKAGGGKRLTESNFYPELVKLREKGWSYNDMAHYFGQVGGPQSARRYTQIIQKQTEERKPKIDPRDLPPDVQALTRWDIDAFEQFFLRYSGYDYFPRHVRSWVSAFLREKNLMLNVPPGHAKSTFFMTWIPIWLICRDRNVQILLGSNSGEDAATWAMEVAGQLEFNQDLIHDFGRFAPETVGDQRWTPGKGVFSVLGRDRHVLGAQFTMESRGMTSRVLGRRADFVIIDDPTKQEDAESPVTRDKQIKKLRQEFFTRAEPEGEWQGGRVAVIGQRVHMLDCYGALEKQEWERGDKFGQKVFHVEKYPAVLDWEKKVTLWPERFNWEEIELAYARVGGQAAFETMYQQNPMPEGAALVTRAQLEACFDRDRRGGQGFKSEEPMLPIVRVLSLDPSPTKFNGIVMGDLMWHKEKFAFAVTYVSSSKMGLEQVKNECDRLIAQYHPDYFIVEESGFMAWLRNDPWFVELERRIKLIRHHTGMNKNSMEFGVQSLAGDFEFQNIRFPYGDTVGQRMTEILCGEALQYPDGDTYDTLMALWFIKFNYKRLSPSMKNLGDHRKGKGSKGGWSFLNPLKQARETEEALIREYRKHKQEMMKVGS